jgi:hypothetical protein
MPGGKQDFQNQPTGQERNNRSSEQRAECTGLKEVLQRVKQKIRNQEVRISFYPDRVGDFLAQGPSRILTLHLEPEVWVRISELHHGKHPCLWDLLRQQARLINDAHHPEQDSDSVKGECLFADGKLTEHEMMEGSSTLFHHRPKSLDLSEAANTFVQTLMTPLILCRSVFQTQATIKKAPFPGLYQES